MIATQSQCMRCTIRGASAVVIFYPDNRIVRICAEGGRRFEEMRWHFGWDALIEAIGARNVEADAGSSTAAAS